MRIRRLGWAGIEVSTAEATLVVDCVDDFALLTASQPAAAFVKPSRPAVVALVTHLHEDHTDVAAIQSAAGATGLMLRPAPLAVGGEEEATFTHAAEAKLAGSSLDVRIVAEWQPIEVPPFTVTAVPAVDGLGDPQVNWVIEADGQRVFHGGDTLFHGYWWLIARRAGPIDVAVLPINGAVVNVPHLQPPSPYPAVLTPGQAATAAAVLRAKALVPMHFGVHQPPGYVEQVDPLARLGAAAEPLSVRVLAMAPGDDVDVARVLH